MKLQKTCLALLLPLLLPLSLQGQSHGGAENRSIIIPSNTIVPSKKWFRYEKRLEALDHEFQEANVLPFSVSEASEGMIIPVKLHDIFKIAFLLPDDTDGGLETHMVLAPQLPDFKNPIQGWDDRQAILLDAGGNSIDFATFYGLTGLPGKPHTPALQSGVTTHASYIANEVGTYPLTFTVIDSVWTTDIFPAQYRSYHANRKNVTIYIEVTDDE